jgi:hypothetical protein
MKLFQVPINHPYIQNLTGFDLDFIEYSTLWDNPKIREKLQNTFYDDEFDEWADETEALTPEEEALFNAQNASKDGGVGEISDDTPTSPELPTDDDYVSLDNETLTDEPDEWEEDE